MSEHCRGIIEVAFKEFDDSFYGEIDEAYQ